MKGAMLISWLLTTCFFILIHITQARDWTQCNTTTNGCNCKWISGKKTANCSNAKLYEISSGLKDFASEIQVLNLDGNNLGILSNHTFTNFGLVNLQKISLRDCNIREVEKKAFYGLFNLFEVDLSDNSIRELDPATFATNHKLRYVSVNNNLLEKLDDELFNNLDQLQGVYLDDNKISYISEKAFHESPLLKHVSLSNNKLTNLNYKTFSAHNLQSLELNNNPWNCSCNLRPFLHWYKWKNEPLYYDDVPTCAEPMFLRTIPWDKLELYQIKCEDDD